MSCKQAIEESVARCLSIKTMVEGRGATVRTIAPLFLAIDRAYYVYLVVFRTETSDHFAGPPHF